MADKMSTSTQSRNGLYKWKLTLSEYCFFVVWETVFFFFRIVTKFWPLTQQNNTTGIRWYRVNFNSVCFSVCIFHYLLLQTWWLCGSFVLWMREQFQSLATRNSSIYSNSLQCARLRLDCWINGVLGHKNSNGFHTVAWFNI